MQPLFQLAHGREVLIKTLAIGVSNITLKAAHVFRQSVEDASSFFQFVNAALDGRLTFLHKHALEQSRWAVFRRQEDSVARPRQAAVCFVDIHAEIKRREPRLLPETFGRELIERDRVAKTAARWIFGGSEKTVLRRMSTNNVRMRQTAEDGETVPIFPQVFEEWR